MISGAVPASRPLQSRSSPRRTRSGPLWLARREALWAIKSLRGEPLPLFAAASGAAGGAMPGQLELSRAALDRVDDLVSDALVNIAPVGLHG